tara:strand:+ start:3232 stop:3492 length:261 start_codon:yes stop_codon:yes gene_type:complete
MTLKSTILLNATRLGSKGDRTIDEDSIIVGGYVYAVSPYHEDKNLPKDITIKDAVLDRLAGFLEKYMESNSAPHTYLKRVSLNQQP